MIIWFTNYLVRLQKESFIHYFKARLERKNNRIETTLKSRSLLRNISNLMHIFFEECYIVLSLSSYSLPAFVTLEYVLSAISTHPWIRRHRRAATWTLKHFTISLHVLKKVRILDHQIACNNWQWELNLNFSLAAL